MEKGYNLHEHSEQAVFRLGVIPANIMVSSTTMGIFAGPLRCVLGRV